MLPTASCESAWSHYFERHWGQVGRVGDVAIARIGGERGRGLTSTAPLTYWTCPPMRDGWSVLDVDML